MFVQQLYTSCLAEAAYYIESNGEAAIIDPIRETKPYLELAQSRGAKIKYVFETHFHADFVSGHIDLSKATGAPIVFGPTAETGYNAYVARDGEEFKIGHLTIRAMHTPGHTPESTSYLLLDESYQPYCIFTGDTLFVGDVGRPDLLDGKMSSRELASMMYDSLNNKIKNLPDELIVYPAHGPGSACGKSLGKETWSTIGEQKKTNYALREMSREEFINEITTGLLPPPTYFFSDAAINKMGYSAIDSVMQQNMKALSANEVEEKIQNGATLLDTRPGYQFEKSFIPGSINIGLNGMFAIWVGTILDIKKPIVVIAEPGKEEESILRLARVGYEKVEGYLQGGIQAWADAGKKTDYIQSIDAADLPAILRDESEMFVLDVRNKSEAENGHLPSASLIPLADLKKNLSSVPKDKPLTIHCAGGYRSMIAASMLKATGYSNLINVRGGWNNIQHCGVDVKTGTPSNSYC